MNRETKNIPDGFLWLMRQQPAWFLKRKPTPSSILCAVGNPMLLRLVETKMRDINLRIRRNRISQEKHRRVQRQLMART